MKASRRSPRPMLGRAATSTVLFMAVRVVKGRSWRTGPTTAESTEAWQSEAREKEERGLQTAENARYGEAISEHGL
jgi:hypothetical protein